MTRWSLGASENFIVGHHRNMRVRAEADEFVSHMSQGDGRLFSTNVFTIATRQDYLVTESVLPSQFCTRETDPIQLDWLFNAISIDEDAPLTVSELAEYISGLNIVISEGRYSMLENILSLAAGQNASSRILLAFARAAYPVRSKITGWRRVIQQIASTLDAKGKDSSTLLKGMI